MTLLRQIMLVVIFIFLILFSANFLLTVYDSRLYLEEQMQVHAQDTATSLALSMTTALSGHDSANLELFASAVFDRGYYQEITLRDPDGKILIARNNPLNIDDVPHWFSQIITLPSPAGYAEIMDGWLMLGTLKVVSHPGHAYRDLWRITVDFFYLFCIITILSYILIGFVLKRIMQPLVEVEQQANDICERKFVILPNIPKTRELKRVVEAMNRMSGKIQHLFQQQLELTENLRREATTDPVTGLANRRAFDATVSAILSSESGPGSSSLMLMQIHQFSRINSELGRLAADDLLKQVAERIEETLSPIVGAVKSRRGGADFAIYIPRITLEKARIYLETTFQSVASLAYFTTESNLDMLHMGASFHEQSTDLSMMLATSDTALRNAISGGSNNTYFLIHGDRRNPVADLVKQAGEWQTTLKQVIENEELLFHYQPIYQSFQDETTRELLAYEIFVRLQLEGRIVKAGVFMPMAERFGLLSQLDQLIITRVFAELKHDSPVFVVNLSTRSIQDETFNYWLTEMLATNQQFADRIIFELQEYSIHLAYPRVKELIDTASPLGYRFSVDHFGSGVTAFSYLQSLNLHFIKIDRSFVAGINEHTDNQFFIQSVSQIAQSRDISLIAEGVETASELETLLTLGVDAVMGYYLGRPGPDF